jgi:hypothetical protein
MTRMMIQTAPVSIAKTDAVTTIMAMNVTMSSSRLLGASCEMP